MDAPPDITRLLVQYSQGDEKALEQLFPMVYGRLQQLAKGYMAKERAGHTLAPTALVHEAFMRLAGSEKIDWQSRAHFFGIAARIMRQILVGHAREKLAAKRGARPDRVTFQEEANWVSPEDPDLLALDEAMKKLAETDERASHVVELRYFGGLTIEESAEVLKISTGTVKRDWERAKKWLFHELKSAA